MKTRLQKILLRIHFITLTIAVLNTFLDNFTPYSLAENVEFGVKFMAVVSGLTLFFINLRPFKKINFYFSIYPTVTFMLIVGLVFRGVFGALILSVLLFPLIPDDKKFEENGIIITTPFQGFLAACCSYQVKEHQLLIFEKKHGRIETEGPINFKTVKIQQTIDNNIILNYTTDFDKEKIKRKTIRYGS